MSPLLGLARLISAMTAGEPAAIFARNAFSNPRGAEASRARRLICASEMRDFDSSTSRRFVARMRFNTFDTSAGLGRSAREAHELVQLGARGAGSERVARERNAIP